MTSRSPATVETSVTDIRASGGHLDEGLEVANKFARLENVPPAPAGRRSTITMSSLKKWRYRVPVAIVVDATPFETEADDVREETTLTRQVPLVELVERRVDVVRIERDATRRQSIVAELDDHEQLAFESRSWVPAADDVARQREAFAPYRQPRLNGRS